VFPLVAFILIAMMVGSLGIFRYQEVVLLSQEGARYASVHGSEYRQEISHSPTPITKQDVYDKAIKPRMMCLNPANVSYDVTRKDNDQPFGVSGTSGNMSDYETAKVNTVTVTVSYKWFPEWDLVGPINLTCSTTVPTAYLGASC